MKECHCPDNVVDCFHEAEFPKMSIHLIKRPNTPHSECNVPVYGSKDVDWKVWVCIDVAMELECEHGFATWSMRGKPEVLYEGNDEAFARYAFDRGIKEVFQDG